MGCGNSAIESSMGSAAKLATATSKMGGAIEQSSVKSSTPDRDGWDRSRQYLVYLRCSCGTRMQTSGGDTFFDAWLKDSRDQRRMQTSRQPCDTMPAHNARNRSVQDGGLQCILGPAPCLLKIVGKFAIDEHSSFRQASSLPLTLSFVRVTSTTTTPTLNTADPCHEPQHTLKLPRPSNRLQGTLHLVIATGSLAFLKKFASNVSTTWATRQQVHQQLSSNVPHRHTAMDGTRTCSIKSPMAGSCASSLKCLQSWDTIDDNRKKLTRARMPSNQDGNHNNELDRLRITSH